MKNDNIHNPIIEIKHYNLTYGHVNIFNDFDFVLEKNEIVGLYGPTGCGKTSLLNKIIEDYINIYKISYVFQDNRLLDNLTVMKNITLPLENIMKKADCESRAGEILQLLDLGNKISDKTSVLSGGERQRVNIGRALVYPCDILLMDEPFSAQDNSHRNKIIELTKKLILDKGISAVIVSHNKDDLYTLCNRIIMIG